MKTTKQAKITRLVATLIHKMMILNVLLGPDQKLALINFSKREK
jgi:hypothetical protein